MSVTSDHQDVDIKVFDESMTKEESRVIQNRIQSLMLNPALLLDFFEQRFWESLLSMCTHKYGNFVIQKFLDTQNSLIFDIISDVVEQHFLRLAKDKYACRVI